MTRTEQRNGKKATPASQLSAVIFLAAVALFMAPSSARACAVCFDLADRAREAYYETTVLLLLVPFAFMAGIGIWLRKAALRQAVDEESTALRASAPRS